MPELLWKAYIDFEVDEGERERARALYERLIEASGHVKVWIAYATFEAESIPIPRADREDEDEDAETPMVDGDVERARVVFGRAYKDLKSKGLKSEVVLPGSGSTTGTNCILAGRSARGLEDVRRATWHRRGRLEGASHDAHRQQAPACRRRNWAGGGRYVVLFLRTLVPDIWAPDWEMVFADDERESNPTSFKFLQMAHAWKSKQATNGGASGLLSGFAKASGNENEDTDERMVTREDEASSVEDSDEE
jgi:crooked neck